MPHYTRKHSETAVGVFFMLCYSAQDYADGAATSLPDAWVTRVHNDQD